MSAWSEVRLGVDALGPHVLAMALISSRLMPVVFLCPLFGGAAAPMHVKLGVVLALSAFVHLACGIEAPPGITEAIDYVGLAVKEIILGMTMGLVASLPFDAARMGGRFIDTFRGSSAEAALPFAGSKEAATGDAIYHLLLALSASGLTMPLWLSTLVRSFSWVSLGLFSHHEAVALQVVTLTGTAFATGLAVSAPIAALCLVIDALVGLAARAAPSMNLSELGLPLRILGGGAVIWLSVGLIAERFVSFSDGMTGALRLLMELGLG